MGRIHDAMLRQESNEQETGAVFEAVQKGKLNGHVTQSEALPRPQFDFISYSLNPASTEGRNDSMPLREVPRDGSPRQVQQVELDAGRLDPHLVTLSECDPAAAEQYQRLASSLISAANDRSLKRILITSALQGDGRTCVLLNLAGALAQVGRRVLVVDTDLKHPSVFRLLGLDVEAGLTEVLTGKSSVKDTLRKVSPGKFDILPRRAQSENAAELFASPGFGRLLESFDADYDFILFDSAPLLTTDDAHFLLRYVDTALVVVAQGKCSSTQAARAMARIAREDIFGVVMNRLAA
jgi:protein-tyrosine kinase